MRKPVTWCLLIDGTGNARESTDTNIWRLYNLLQADGQRVHYFEGVGTNEDNVFLKFAGGAFGAGALILRDQVCATIRSDYQDGDRILVVGFSRGAAIARKVCSELGLPVDFLVCFDTVGAMLIFDDFHVSPLVKQAYHACSIHERRKVFELAQMNQRDDGSVCEEWFMGGHSDIGGGAENSDGTINHNLSNISLIEAITRIQMQGIHFDPTAAKVFPTNISQPPYVIEWLRRADRQVRVQVNDEHSLREIPRLHKTVPLSEQERLLSRGLISFKGVRAIPFAISRDEAYDARGNIIPTDSL
jgi:hypothetical protein